MGRPNRQSAQTPDLAEKIIRLQLFFSGTKLTLAG
jgi:hypothetical protein